MPDELTPDEIKELRKLLKRERQLREDAEREREALQGGSQACHAKGAVPASSSYPFKF